MSKHAPAREDGLKPYFAEIREWGYVRHEIVWADTAANARYKAINRMRYTTATVRRATPDDLAPAPVAANEETP